MAYATETILAQDVKFKTIIAMSENVAKIEGLKRVAKETLGADYDFVYKFFSEKFKYAQSYKYIIVKARREFILAQIFCCILLAETASKIKSETKTEQADVNIAATLYAQYKHAAEHLRSDIFVYSTLFEEKSNTPGCNERILLLDDIIIHGRALSKLLAYLLDVKKYTTDDIDADSIIICKNAECVSKELEICFVDENKKKDKRVDNGVTTVEWKRLSNKFVELIQYCGQSYAAFIDSYEIDSKYDPARKFNYCITDIKSSAQMNANIDMRIYYETLDFDIHKKLECLRFYTRTEFKDGVNNEYRVCIPFVSLPFLKLSDWRDFCNTLTDFTVSTETNSYTQDIYIYKLISNIESNKFAQSLELYNATTNNLQYSFGRDTLSDDLYKNLKEFKNKAYYIYTKNETLTEKIDEGQGTICVDYKQELAYFSSLESVKIWRETIEQHKQETYACKLLFKMMTKYLNALNIKNETLAAQHKSRLQGIPVYALFVALKHYAQEYGWNIVAEDYWAFYAYIISQWDVGMANYTVDVFMCNKEYYIGGCITDGEQAYHALMEPASAFEVFAIHLLNSYTATSAEFHKKLGELITDARMFGGFLDSTRLENVGNYFIKNKSVKELLQLYPATDEQQQELRSYIRTLCN